MKTTIRTLRRIVKEELEQLTLPGVDVGPSGEEAWQDAWNELQVTRRALNAALDSDDETEWSIAKREFDGANARFNAVNDAMGDDGPSIGSRFD